MKFLTSVYTDVGLTKPTNQDSVLLKVANTGYGRVAFCVVCDGMGGLAMGELASATLVHEFNHWFLSKFPELLYRGMSEDRVRRQWEEVIYFANKKIMGYGQSRGLSLGTTTAALLIAKDRVMTLNVGDTRVYEISDGVHRLTTDQTLVAREVAQGLLTEEAARSDERRNVLLQCVGASQAVAPDIRARAARRHAVYMVCTDGFWHEITDLEIFACLNSNVLKTEQAMHSSSQYLVELSKLRQETDNITVALIRTC